MLRHGVAEDARPGQPDSERPLTGEGREKLRRVLKRARGADLDPSLILSSPYRRAIETAAVAAEVLAYNGEIVRTRALVPESSPFDAWEEIRSRKDRTQHSAGQPRAADEFPGSFLLDSPALRVDMKKAALVRIDCERFGPKPDGMLKWMLTPGVCLE